MVKKTNTKKQEKNELVKLENKEVEERIDVESIKTELNEYMKGQIDYYIKQEIDKTNKRIIKVKNRQIFSRNIVILLLIAAIGYLGFRLYENGYFNKYFQGEKKETYVVTKEDSPKKEELEPTPKEETKPTLEELKKEYSSLLNPIILSGNSNYLEEYYKGNLTEELKLSIALANVKQSDIETEVDMSFVEENLIKEAYERIFDTKYEGKSFVYNAESMKYSAARKMYIANGELRIASNTIQKEIVDIQEGEDVVITTIEGYISEGKLYNKKTNERIENYDSKKDFIEYKDKLASVKYTFHKNNDSYKLIKIESN